MRLQVAHHYPAQQSSSAWASFGAQFVSGIIMPIDAGWGSRQECLISSALGKHGGHVLGDRNSAVGANSRGLGDDEMINLVKSTEALRASGGGAGSALAVSAGSVPGNRMACWFGFVNVAWGIFDFEPHLARCYLDVSGFQRTDAGLMHLPTSRTIG